ncbi:hypothetical protein WJX73_008781 [Symbiochloris irregularis]|uniref:Uncharacterized protein n=1 Tax=Symbiochloris irregularis TaxID=706552 RepID=A0AAW1PDT2_9CHLO
MRFVIFRYDIFKLPPQGTVATPGSLAPSDGMLFTARQIQCSDDVECQRPAVRQTFQCKLEWSTGLSSWQQPRARFWT